MYESLNTPRTWFLFAINFVQDYDFIYPNLEAALGCIFVHFSESELETLDMFLKELINSNYSEIELGKFWHEYSQADFRPINGSMRENFSQIKKLLNQHKNTPLTCRYKIDL
jgi:hypothetical protein